ncbi:hypothetical protein ACSQ67_025748 [Phaseolus vulgaris]
MLASSKTAWWLYRDLCYRPKIFGVKLQVITQTGPLLTLHQTQPVQRPSPIIEQNTLLRAAAPENLPDCFSQIWVRKTNPAYCCSIHTFKVCFIYTNHLLLFSSSTLLHRVHHRMSHHSPDSQMLVIGEVLSLYLPRRLLHSTGFLHEKRSVNPSNSADRNFCYITLTLASFLHPPEP